MGKPKEIGTCIIVVDQSQAGIEKDNLEALSTCGSWLIPRLPNLRHEP